ncbi:MAG: glutamate synthase-related protein [Cyanobacteriota bacterium]|nr:glutamate synthase-related protein [Cyanobacteriota bacterium]
MNKVKIAPWDELPQRQPIGALVEGVDLVIVRWEDKVSVLYGRCKHRGALMADGSIQGADLICGLHQWDYRFETGVSAYNNSEYLDKFQAWVEDGNLYVDADEIIAWKRENPQPYNRDKYQGQYADPTGTEDEPHNQFIQQLAAGGLSQMGQHGPVAAMGVPAPELPQWDDLQFLTAQLARLPQLDEVEVGTELVIGPNAKQPLKLDLPLFVSDMSFGALSEEAKIALSKGAELAGTGICSGEGGMLPEERSANSRYFYELASARFGFSMEKLMQVQAFHFKCGQAAKTGIGAHLPGEKVNQKIAEVREVEEGETAVSPARFPDWESVEDYRRFAETVRDVTGGIPVGVKLSAQHIEMDIDAALEIGVDYIILDGRGGGTGGAPLLFRNHISVPTIPALARARRHLDKREAKGVTLIVTGGLRTPADFAKALALGADGIALANAAIQAIGCLGMRACHTNNCPVGIATQKKDLRSRLIIDESAQRLDRFLRASVELMQVLARGCGHTDLNQFCLEDLTTWKRDMAYLSGVKYGGVMPLM